MCKGIKDLFLVLYRNLIHHLHPLWVISECFGDKELAVFLVFAVVLVGGRSLMIVKPLARGGGVAVYFALGATTKKSSASFGGLGFFSYLRRQI